MVKEDNIERMPAGGIERDVDYHNQRLWKKKIYKKRLEKNDRRKMYKNYKRELADDEQENNEDASAADQKK